MGSCCCLFECIFLYRDNLDSACIHKLLWYVYSRCLFFYWYYRHRLILFVIAIVAVLLCIVLHILFTSDVVFVLSCF